MKLNQDQIEALRRLGGWAEELAYKVFIGESVTVEREVKRWEPASGNYFSGAMGSASGPSPSSDEFRLHGVERKTREAAERLAHDQRIFNRLHAYREEFAPGYVVEEMKRAGYVYQSDGHWRYGCDTIHRVAGVVYMPEDVAEDLALKLNSGEVVL